jgi:TetR/AcrR family transcriptional regulator, cholesterol catabolism regulator
LEGAITTLRDARKLATRRRVLDAAHALFEDVGYEAATIRAIAKRAGVSVGSVFSSFASKSHVLSEVMQERLTDLYADLASAAPHLKGSTADRCRSLFAVHYAFEYRRLRLFLAYVSAAFDWSAGPGARSFGANPHLRGMVRECLEVGVARGDVRPDIDVDLVVDMLIGAYAWNYRLATTDDATPAQLIDLFDRQIEVIFDGLRPVQQRQGLPRAG